MSNCDNEELQTARSTSDQQETVDTQVHGDRPRRKAATKALQQNGLTFLTVPGRM